ncbi:MAG TPA: ABC transporter permease, partial [Gemmatimonadota bacterium]|nr:ABC transporter permease [Gemmatimonadota bacterium]
MDRLRRSFVMVGPRDRRPNLVPSGPPVMLQYALRRIVHTIPVLAGVLVVTFVLLYIAPGDPVLAMVGDRFDPATLDRLRAELHLDEPVWKQFYHYVSGLIRGDWGTSYITRQPVLDGILEHFPKTLYLASVAILFATLSGVAIGVLSAVRQSTWIDGLGMTFAFLGISFPVYWIGLILILIVAVEWGALPPSGFGGGALPHLILPALTLGMRSTAYIARLTRSSMLEVIRLDYIRTARAKGLAEWTVIGKHALKAALIPVVTAIGLDFGAYLSGSVLTESIFAWPGIGRFALNAILKRDLPVIQGTVLFLAIVFVLVNLVVDLLYGMLDPRVRY